MKDLIKKQKIYQVEAMLEGDVFPTEKEKMDYLEEQGFPDRKSYEKALQEAGGPLDERAQGAANREKEKEKQIKNLLSRETIRQEANRMLNSPEGGTASGEDGSPGHAKKGKRLHPSGLHGTAASGTG